MATRRVSRAAALRLLDKQIEQLAGALRALEAMRSSVAGGAARMVMEDGEMRVEVLDEALTGRAASPRRPTR
jgi:hypothetical protein